MATAGERMVVRADMMVVAVTAVMALARRRGGQKVTVVKAEVDFAAVAGTALAAEAALAPAAETVEAALAQVTERAEAAMEQATERAKGLMAMVKERLEKETATERVGVMVAPEGWVWVERLEAATATEMVEAAMATERVEAAMAMVKERVEAAMATDRGDVATAMPTETTAGVLCKLKSYRK